MNGHDKFYDKQRLGSYDEPVAPTTFGHRAKAHYKRFWWLHLIIFIIGFLIVFLLIFFVGFSNIAQGQLNRASLDLVSEQVFDPQPNSVQIRLVTTANNPSPYHPRLEAFNASLFLEDTLPDIKPFGTIFIPELVAGKETNITINQRLVIEDMEQFIQYNLRTLQSDTYRLGVRGKTTLHEMKFRPTEVDFNQVITTKGLNALQGLNITSLNIHLLPLPDGSNADGTIAIPNPSSQDIFLGNVTSNLLVDGQIIGNATIPNMRLAPGMNNLPMTSVTDQGQVISLVTNKYKDGILPVQIVGSTVVNNGQRLIYFEESLKQTVINTSLNVGAALQAIGVNVTALAGGGGAKLLKLI